MHPLQIFGKLLVGAKLKIDFSQQWFQAAIQGGPARGEMVRLFVAGSHVIACAH